MIGSVATPLVRKWFRGVLRRGKNLAEEAKSATNKFLLDVMT